MRALAGLCVLVAACRTAPAPDPTPLPPLPPPAEARSLLGELLAPPELEPARRAELEADLDRARADLASDPGSEAAVVWVGRRLAYLGRYREAIATYTRGLARHPGSFRLLRHRGHRFVSVRELDRAVDDLSLASRLLAGVPDEIEPDGAPNPAGVPRSTNHSNVEYHLGLALFLRGDFDAAAAAWRRGLEYSRVNDDMLCATSHWLYAALRRLGRDREAAALLEPVHPGMEILENHAYHRLLLFYRGDLAAEEVLADAPEDGVEFATAAFGLAHWMLVEGERDAGLALCRRIVDRSPWNAFGRIAAEAELARSLH